MYTIVPVNPNRAVSGTTVINGIMIEAHPDKPLISLIAINGKKGPHGALIENLSPAEAEELANRLIHLASIIKPDAKEQ